MKTVRTCLLMITGLSGVLFAVGDLQPLYQKCPDETIGVLATSGTEDFGAEFKSSILGQIAADPQVKTFFEQLYASVTKSKDFNSDEAGVFIELAKQVLKSPTIIAIAADKEDLSGDPVFVLISKVPADRAALDTAFNSAVKIGLDAQSLQKQTIAQNVVYTHNDPNTSETFYTLLADDYLIAAANDDQFSLLSSAASNTRLAAVFEQVPSSQDAFIYYLDIHRLITLMEQSDSGDSNAQTVKAAMQSLGLYDLQDNLAYAGFEGKNIVVQDKLKTPVSNGIWNAFGSVDRNLFNYVDPKAMQAGIINMNPLVLYDQILSTLKTVDPAAFETFDKKIAEVEATLSFKLRDDFLANIDGSFMGYVLPAYTSPELTSGGYVITAKLKDVEKINNCLVSLGNLIESLGEQQVQVTSQQTPEGKEIHIWAVSVMAMAQIIPSWAIEGDTLIFTSHPSLTKRVVTQFVPGQHDSMTSDPAFAALLKSVPSDAFMIGLSDSKTSARQLVQMLQRVWPMITMGMMNDGIQLPIMLPSLESYIEQMEPGLRYARKTSDGIEAYYRGSGLEASSGGVAGGGMAAAILMPALSKTKKIAQRVVSGTNLKGIGTACVVYANDHDDNFPSDLEVLISECDLSPETLVSSRKPAGFEGPSYVLIQGLTAEAPANTVLAYENPAFCNDGQVNVLYVDGHVAAEDKSQLRSQLQKTYEYLKKPVPAINWGKD